MAPSRQDDDKRLQGQARKMSNELSGCTLAHAFKKAGAVGLCFFIARIDGTKREQLAGHDPLRLNVEVVDGIVRKAWVG